MSCLHRLLRLSNLESKLIPADRRKSKTLIPSTNVDKKSLEIEFLMPFVARDDYTITEVFTVATSANKAFLISSPVT